MLNITRFTLLLILAVTLTAYSYSNLQQLAELKSNTRKSNYNEVLYLPNGHALQAISLDYKTLLANILWFNTVSYFGKHFRSDQNYTWLNHMCNLVTDLDAQAEHVFEFCSLMLAWELQQAELSVKLLNKAIQSKPDYWRYYYLAGMTKAFFMKDFEAAHNDFAKASNLDNVPLFLVRMASKTLSGLENPESAVQFLKDLIARSNNEAEKEALQKHLKQTIHDLNIDQLEQKIANFKVENLTAKQVQQLLPEINKLPDPFGGQYYWDEQARKVRSTSGVERGKSLVKNKTKL